MKTRNQKARKQKSKTEVLIEEIKKNSREWENFIKKYTLPTKSKNK